MDLNEIVRWAVSRGLLLLVGCLVLLFLYRFGSSAIERVIPRLLNAQAEHLPADASSADEVAKRVATIEDLLTRLLRLTVIALLGALVLAVFDLWTILAGIVLIVVAITFATQDVVLDYVMGFLILVEGPFFKGDWIRVGGPGGVEGTVEEIGLRRTLLRDRLGSMHAVSNGLIRQSSNVTRVFSVATVELQVLHASDVDRAIEAAFRVTRALRDDPDWADRVAPDVPSDVWVTGLTLDGASLRIVQRVPTGQHAPVASELRRRLASALASDAIGTARWDTPLPVATHDITPTTPRHPSRRSGRSVSPTSSVSGDGSSTP
jgi:moderate conductance mechanosensitive channel